MLAYTTQNGEDDAVVKDAPSREAQLLNQTNNFRNLDILGENSYISWLPVYYKKNIYREYVHPTARHSSFI
jgi:hypothetical protein